MTGLQLAILSDPRLSEGACKLGLWISQQAGAFDGIELRFDAMREVLYGFPGDDSIRRHIRMLEGAKWITKVKVGGRGHADMWCLASAEAAPYPNRAPLGPTLNTFSPGVDPTLSPHVVVGGSSSNPPIVPPVVGQVSKRADEMIDASGVKLEGCRGALRDYLAARVPIGSQAGYVGTLLGWLDGLDGNVWTKPDGTKLEPDKRTGVLAAALNELATADEDKQRKWAPGDVQNLRNKIEFILKPRTARTYGTGSGRGGKGSGETPRGTGKPGLDALWGRTPPPDRASGSACA